MNQSAQFAQYAERCVRLAESSDGSHRALMLSMAHAWSKLAEQAQRDTKLEANERDLPHAA